MHKVVADIEYISGHIRSGHFVLYLTDTEIADFRKISPQEQENWVKEDGELVVDDYYLNDIGDITYIEY